MTESEAIEKIKKDICHGNPHGMCKDSCMLGKEMCAYDMATRALEEIQQYRAIGKVEEVRWMVSTYHDMIHDFGDDMLALKEYRDIGTVSEFRELKGKAKPTVFIR